MAFIPPMIAAISATVASATTATAATAATAAGASTAASAGAGIASAAAGMAAATPWLGYASLASTAIGGVTSAVGAVKAGSAEASAAKYNSEVAAQNAAQQKTNTEIAGQAGAQQAGMSSMKTRNELGAILTNQAASGLDVNSGSPLDVRSSARELGQLDALTVRSNATRSAYGYQVQSASDTGESQLGKAEASNDLAGGYVNAGGTLLSSAGTAGMNFAKYQLAGGFSG